MYIGTVYKTSITVAVAGLELWSHTDSSLMMAKFGDNGVKVLKVVQNEHETN